jgi:hypothetical protein
MKIILDALIILFFGFLASCSDTSIEILDTTISEKRIVSKRDSLYVKSSIEDVLNCLSLTRNQRYIIDSVIRIRKQCNIECKKEFNDAIKIIRIDFNSKMNQYHRVEKTEEIKKQIEFIKFEFRQTTRDLEKEYKKRILDCLTRMHTDIEKNLNPEQLVIWNNWKFNGKVLCEKVKP